LFAQLKNLWTILDPTIEESLTHEMEVHFKNLNKKLDNLQTRQRKEKKIKTEQEFYKRTINLTTIVFNQEEMELLNTGMQHSIEQPLNHYWNDLIIETEQAIKNWNQKHRKPSE